MNIRQLPGLAETARSIEILRVTRKLEELARNHESTLCLLKEPLFRKRTEVKNLVVACGSYDPLSIAHESLFLKGLDLVSDDKKKELLIAATTSHFEKEVEFGKNSTIYDRIHALEGFASCHENVATGIYNNPLFINLAKDVRKNYDDSIAIYFIVGSDVMKKVANPQNYENPEKTFTELFKNNFMVCRRTINDTLVGMDEIMNEFEHLRKYEDKFLDLSLKQDQKLRIPISKVSSTIIRDLRSRKERTEDLEAVGISDFIDKRSLYLEDDMLYMAFTALREHYEKEFQNRPIREFIDSLYTEMKYMANDEDYQKKMIAMGQGSFCVHDKK